MKKRVATRAESIKIITIPDQNRSCTMGAFLKVFELVLMGLSFYFTILGAPLALIIGLGGETGFTVQFIPGIALIAGSITLFTKVRR